MPKFFFDRISVRNILPEIFQKIKQQRLRDFPQALLLRFSISLSVFFYAVFLFCFKPQIRAITAMTAVRPAPRKKEI